MAHVSTSLPAVPRPEGSRKPGKPVKPEKKDKDKGQGKDKATGLARVAPVDPTAPASGPTSRINIALPFSKIGMQEPSQELADLVTLVGDLLVALKGTLSAAEFEAFEAQVDSLHARLR